MRWAELSDKEKTRLVLEHVMGCFVLNATAIGWNTPEHPRGVDAVAIGFHWPIAFWNTDGECWMMRDIATDPDFFSPLRNLNDAWQIVEKMLARQEEEHYLNGFEWNGPQFKPSHHYLTHEGYPLGTTCWYVYLCVDGHCQFVCAETPQDAVCLAALRAVGVTIE